MTAPLPTAMTLEGDAHCMCDKKDDRKLDSS